MDHPSKDWDCGVCFRGTLMVPLLWPPKLTGLWDIDLKQCWTPQRGRTCSRTGLFWVWSQGMKLSLQGGNVFEHKWVQISRATWRSSLAFSSDWHPTLTIGVYTDSVLLSSMCLYLQTQVRVHRALSLPPLSLLFIHALVLLLEETSQNFKCTIIHVLHNRHTSYILCYHKNITHHCN